MSKDYYVAGLDIGSANVRVLVCSPATDPDQEIMVRAAVTEPMQGMQKGTITDVEAAVSSLSKALDNAERMAGVPIERAYVSINGSHLSSQNSRGVIAVSRADGEITPDDVDRVINAAQAISLPANREILHVLPQQFVVDGQESIQDPVGMNGVRLEVEAHIIDGSAPFIKNLTKAVNQAGVHIDDFVFSPLAAAKAVLDKRQKDLGVALVDLGAGTTSLVVYEDSTMLHTAVLPFGASHVTNDIAIGLRTSIDIAETVKINHGTVSGNDVKDNESILIEDEEGGQESFSRKEMVGITSARFDEILAFINGELKKINRSGLLPAGVVFTGAGAKLPGIVELAKEKLKLPVKVGQPEKWEGLSENVQDPSFAVCVGLVKWAMEQESRGSRSLGLGVHDIGNSVNKIRGWLKTFMP